MRKIFKYLSWFCLLFIALPIAIGAGMGYAKGWPKNWRIASWDSAGVLPDANTVTAAKVMLLSTRTGRWKSIFAEHMSIVLKPAGASDWTRYDVVGWGTPVRKNAYAADARWYGNTPRVIFEISGAEAAAVIPDIETTIANYPHRAKGSYTVWPGPNSNTFVAYVVRNTPGLKTELPPVAVGKDWLGDGLGFAPAPSKTGYSFSVSGVIGGTAAWEEGLELHLLGSTIGFDVNDLAIKLPALGKVGVW